MDIKMCLVVILLSVIATDNVLAAVSGTKCSNGDDDCKSIAHTECNTESEPQVCKCKDGYQENNNKCQPELDGECTTSDTCADANAACTDTDTNGGVGTCKCSSGFKDNPCVAKGLNDDCTVDTDCSDVTHAVCSGDDKCSCDTGYVPNEGACDQVLTDIVCSGNGDCPGNAICNADKTCECDMDFTLQDNQCAGAGSTKAMIWMMLSSLLILLVDKLLM